MTKFFIGLLISLSLCFSAASANPFDFLKRRAESDKQTLDSLASKLTNQASQDAQDFNDNLCQVHNLSKDKFNELTRAGIPSPDAFMLLNIADLSGKPLDCVLGSYNKNHGRGWGVIAKDMGIAPGSKAFHALKGKVSGEVKRLKLRIRNKSKAAKKAKKIKDSKSKGKGRRKSK